MSFLICFALAAVLSVLLRKPIKSVPWAFYLVCVALDVLLLAMRSFTLPQAIMPALSMLMQRGNLAMALFAVVMYIGVLPKDSKFGIRMRTIRAELSIIAWILCMGHMCLYLTHYLTHAPSGAMRVNLLASFMVAIVLFVLLLILGVTSFTFVKRRMHARTWKRVQLLAYPFFLLAYVHLMLMLAPSALSEGTTGESAVIGIVVYSVVFVAYVALRLRRRAIDRNAEAMPTEEAAAIAQI